MEICVDKAATSFALARRGLPTPPTWTVQSEQAARQIVRREAGRGPLVLKPLFGAQGFGLKLIRREDDLPPFEAVEGVYYLQRFVAVERNGFRDIRLFVSQGEVIAAMTRHAAHWITNVKLGARPEWCEPDAAMIDLALRAAAAVGAEFAGVDMIRDAADAPADSRSQQHARLARLAEGRAFFDRRPARRGHLGPHWIAAGEGGLVNAIAEAFIAACRDEIEAPKPGNVHVFADGHGMSVRRFPHERRGRRPGFVHVVVAGRRAHSCRRGSDLRGGRHEHQSRHHSFVRAARRGGGDRRRILTKLYARLLAGLTRADAAATFHAILRASPAGLATAPRHDVQARRCHAFGGDAGSRRPGPDRLSICL